MGKGKNNIIVFKNFRFAFVNLLKSDDFRSHFFLLPNTFIYESILIKNYMNANIMNTQIFNLNKYDLKGDLRSQKFIQI